MYTLLVSNKNEVIASNKIPIMQRSKLMNNLLVRVPEFYGDDNEFDMLDFTAYMEYVTPTSKEYKSELLTMESSLYVDANSNTYVDYQVPFDTALTKEAGDVEVQFSFIWEEMDATGAITQYVRKTETCTITILPVSKWADIVPDSALNALDQRILTLTAQINELNAIAETYSNEKADNMEIGSTTDEDGNTTKYLTLTSTGSEIGSKIELANLGDEITEENSDGLIKVII